MSASVAEYRAGARLAAPRRSDAPGPSSMSHHWASGGQRGQSPSPGSGGGDDGGSLLITTTDAAAATDSVPSVMTLLTMIAYVPVNMLDDTTRGTVKEFPSIETQPAGAEYIRVPFSSYMVTTGIPEAAEKRERLARGGPPTDPLLLLFARSMCGNHATPRGVSQYNPTRCGPHPATRREFTFPGGIIVRYFRAFLIAALIGAPLALLSQQQSTQTQQQGQQQTPPPQGQPQAQQQPQGRGGQGAPDTGEEGGRGGRGGPGATFAGLRLRSIGPATTSGRVAALAVDPTDRANYYVAAASGGVWKTTNAGTTFTPVFDTYGSYSIGAIALDPKNTAVVWVGTGENNSQRSVGFGDGIYKSEDGGRTFRNVGLKNSEHIGKILIDPRNSEVVYVAAQGPLWGPGGDRGLYKTTDGGKTWKAVLTIGGGAHTGVSDVVMDPENPDVLFASAYQRERKVWTLIDGGPESGMYRSTDAGTNWTRVRSGLPMGDIGRIGFASRLRTRESSTRRWKRASGAGESFARRTAAPRGSGATIRHRARCTTARSIADPKNADRIFVMNVNIMTSDDGGTHSAGAGRRARSTSTTTPCGSTRRTRTITWWAATAASMKVSTAGNNWIFKTNLPVTQFYDVVADTDAPFYNVYGGTQDNFSLGGPARTRDANGIINADWFVTQGGDGFHSRVDPAGPQHGLRRVAGRRPGPLRPAHGRKTSESSRSRARASRRCAGIGTRR